MKITIYELLGLVKDGKAPKKIKVYGKVYINNNCNCYLDEKDKSLCENVEIPMFLNDEIEIINDKKILQFDKEKVKIGNSLLEEEKKIPEKLDYCEENTFSKRQNGMTSEDRRLLDSNFKEIGNKINEIIDYLKSKGE